ncbi:MAG: cupin domain-containing protein [Chthoniobacterales bacterium]
MKLTNIAKGKAWFEVLQTTERSQTAMMTLAASASTGAKPEAHEQSDQVLLMLQGELTGEVGQQRVTLQKGDVLIISAGEKHRFTNLSEHPAMTFNVYSPPEYPPDAKG